MPDISELIALTAIEAAEKIAAGELSAEAYTSAFLERIEGLDGRVHAFAHHDPADALAQARALDERRRNGQAIGPLHGIPVAIQDVFDTSDYPTECGSALFKGRHPMRDATAVARLRIAGAVIIGKTATTEFGCLHPGPTRNPYDPERTAGGSSSGSAAAVAAGMVPLAIGSQSLGSTIQPASYCGVYGIKPSQGLISRARIMPLSQALDQVGAFARSLVDLALILEVLAGYDADDPATHPVAAPAFLDTVVDSPPMPPRLAFMRTPAWDQVDPPAQQAFAELEAELGASMDAVPLPDAFAAAWTDERTIVAADTAHNLSAIASRAGDTLSASLRGLLAEGRDISAVDYLAARDAARRYATALAPIFDRYDAILTPATTGPAPKGAAIGSSACCTLWTLTGLPALSLPLLSGEGDMPLGVQLVGPAGDDARLLRTANWLVQKLSG